MSYRKHPAAAHYVADHVQANGPVSIMSIRLWLSDKYPAQLTHNEQTYAILDAVNRGWISYIAATDSYEKGPIDVRTPTPPTEPANTTPPSPCPVVYQLIAYPEDTDPTDERSYTLAIFRHEPHAELFAAAIATIAWRTLINPIPVSAQCQQLYDLFY